MTDELQYLIERSQAQTELEKAIIQHIYLIFGYEKAILYLNDIEKKKGGLDESKT